jgi:hypothetical protein
MNEKERVCTSKNTNSFYFIANNLKIYRKNTKDFIEPKQIAFLL